MKINELFEDGVITAYNTTVDVKPGETERQAAKLFPMNKDGKPKPLHSSAAKNSTPNKLFNLGLTENMSVTGTERRRLEKKKGIEIGTPEWFKHWFDLPYLREDITKQELLAKLKDQQRSRYIKAMLDAMHQLVQSKGTRHSIGNYAYEIAKTFGYSPKDLEKMYRDTYDVPHDSMVRTEDVTQPQLNALEKAVDNVFRRIGIDVEFTRHFLDRANDERNGKPITIRELGRLFAKEYKRWGKPIAQMGPDTEAVMKDLESDINIPFALRWNGKELELIAKTVMRKKNFSTSNKQFPVENTQGSLAQKINWGGQNKPAKKPTAPKQQDVSWWQRLQQRAFGDADVAENFAEGYKLQLERDKEMLVLNITDTKTGKRTEVRGKSGYETGGYDPKDSLHILLDKVGKSVDISQLMNGEPVGINPKHPKGASAKAATDKAYSENFAEAFDTKIKWTKTDDRPASTGGHIKKYRGKIDKHNIEMIYNFAPKAPEVNIVFTVDGSMKVTAKGNQMKIFGAVINHITSWINEHPRINLVNFSAHKEDPDDPDENSRSKLYSRLVKRYASKMGFKVEEIDIDVMVLYVLKRKAK